VLEAVLRVLKEERPSWFDTVGEATTDIYKNIYKLCEKNKLHAVTIMLLACIRQATSSNPDREMIFYYPDSSWLSSTESGIDRKESAYV
jgi:hypothetical protein